MAQKAQAELIVKKSRFIGQVAPVSGEGEACDFIEDIRSQHKAANHNVFAYRIGPGAEIERCSDDGEPAGTAGRPVLDVLKRNNITNAVIVVTRYFGGILLGAPGLVRAYSQCARMGIEAAGIRRRSLHDILAIRVDYEWLGKARHLIETSGGVIRDAHYTDAVELVAESPKGDTERIVSGLRDLTGGRAEIHFKGVAFL